MACTVEIDGSDVNIVSGSLSIDTRVEERSTASFTVIDLDASADYVDKTPVKIYDPDDTLIFGGFIDIPERIQAGPGLTHFISCIDNHYLADKRLVIKSYEDKTLTYIVNDIWTDYLDAEGITIGSVDVGPVISEAIFNYVHVNEAFDALKELSGYTWYIDKNKALYFIERGTVSAPWDLDNSTYRPIDGTVKLNKAAPLYRNNQYIRGGTGLTLEQTETFTGDAETQAFTVGYPIAKVPTVTVAAAAKTVGIKGLETGYDCYWNKGDATITFGTAPGNAEAVVIVYYGQYPLIAYALDDTSQTARATIDGSTGMVEEMVTEANHETADAMRESAKGKLALYSKDAERFTYQTIYSGLEPGQVQKVTYSPFSFSAHEMLIESVGITSIGDRVFYDVTAITGPATGSWAKFFSNIITRQDKSIKIGDSLLLVLLYQAESLSLAESTDLDTDDFTSGIVNRWIQLPPTTSSGHNVEHEKLTLAEATNFIEAETEDYEWG